MTGFINYFCTVVTLNRDLSTSKTNVNATTGLKYRYDNIDSSLS